jgi:hypothetical protein
MDLIDAGNIEDLLNSCQVPLRLVRKSTMASVYRFEVRSYRMHGFSIIVRVGAMDLIDAGNIEDEYHLRWTGAMEVKKIEKTSKIRYLRLHILAKQLSGAATPG